MTADPWHDAHQVLDAVAAVVQSKIDAGVSPFQIWIGLMLALYSVMRSAPPFNQPASFDALGRQLDATLMEVNALKRPGQSTH